MLHNKNRIRKLYWPYNLFLYIIPFNIVFDFLSIVSDSKGGPLAITRGILLYISILLICSKFVKNQLLKSVAVFICYISILFATCSNLLASVDTSSKIFISLLMLPVGYSIILSKSDMYTFSRHIFNSLLFLVVGFVINNLFNLGGYTYVETSFQAGALKDSWNILTYALLISPLYAILDEIPQKKRVVFYLFFAVLFIILLISMKRIAISGFFLGILIFIYNYKDFRKTTKYFIFILIFLLAMFPFYSHDLLLKYEARSNHLRIERLLSEPRTYETKWIWEEILSFEDPFKSFFGGEAFISSGHYGGGLFGGRMAHVDYNLIAISNGIVGLLLYLNIYLQIFRFYTKIELSKRKDPDNRLYVSVFWSLVLTSLFTSFSGQMYGITFRSIIFLHIGAILRYLSLAKNVSPRRINIARGGI